MQAATNTNLRGRGIVLVALAGALWSTIGIGVRILDSASSYQVVFFRATGQVPVILAILAVRYRGRIIQPIRSIGWVGAAGALSLSMAYLTGIYAVANTSVANAVFAFSVAPVFAALFGWVVLREPVRLRTFVAMGIALLGVLVLTSGSQGEGAASGNIAGLLAAVFYAGFALALRKQKDIDTIPVIAVSGVFAMILSAFAADGLAIDNEHKAIAWLLGAGALGVGLVLFTMGSKHLTTAELPVVALTEVILAPVWVWIFVGEAMTTRSIVGGSIILGAVLAMGVRFGIDHDDETSEDVHAPAADAAAALHVWPPADMGDPWGSDASEGELEPTEAAMPVGWGERWAESVQGWVELDGELVWRPIITTAADVSGWTIEQFVVEVSADAFIADGLIDDARTLAMDSAVQAAVEQGAHALVGFQFRITNGTGPPRVNARATGVTLSSKPADQSSMARTVPAGDAGARRITRFS